MKWQFGNPIEDLYKEVKDIVGDWTTESLFAALPPTIPYNDTQEAKLTIQKLTDLVYSASYVIYENPGKKDFEKISIIFSTEPTLVLTLFKLHQQLKKSELSL